MQQKSDGYFYCYFCAGGGRGVSPAFNGTEYEVQRLQTWFECALDKVGYDPPALIQVRFYFEKLKLFLM